MQDRPEIHHIVVGTGVVGGALLGLLPQGSVGVDVDTPLPDPPCQILHICIPYYPISSQGEDFVTIVSNYIAKLQPSCTIIHSTVLPGTTDAIASRFPDKETAFSPVHGKHAAMGRDLLYWPKSYGLSLEGADLGMTGPALFEGKMSPLQGENAFTLEWQKLVALAWLAWAIVFHQEVERICDIFDLKETDVKSPLSWECSDSGGPWFPGVIGGHCVILGIELLQKAYPSEFWKIVLNSNELKKIRESKRGP